MTKVATVATVMNIEKPEGFKKFEVVSKVTDSDFDEGAVYVARKYPNGQFDVYTKQGARFDKKRYRDSGNLFKHFIKHEVRQAQEA